MLLQQSLGPGEVEYLTCHGLRARERRFHFGALDGAALTFCLRVAFARCCGLTTRVPSFRPNSARGQSCPSRTRKPRPPTAQPADQHARNAWPFAPLLHVRGLLRVNNPRSVISA